MRLKDMSVRNSCPFCHKWQISASLPLRSGKLFCPHRPETRIRISKPAAITSSACFKNTLQARKVDPPLKCLNLTGFHVEGVAAGFGTMNEEPCIIIGERES